MSCDRTTLGEHVVLQAGYAFKSEDYVETNGIRLLRGNGINQGKIDWSGEPQFPTEKLRGLDRYALAEGDIVLAMDRPWISAGLKFGEIKESDLPAYLVQRVARLRAQPGLDQRFLKYLIASRRFTEYVKAVQTGTAVPHISGGQIKSFEFIRPPLNVQRRIGQILGSLDDKIDLNRKMNRTLESMARTIFKSWFVDFDPVHAKQRGEQPTGIDPTTAALFPDRLTDSELGPIPEGWEVKPLDEIGEFLNGTAVKKYRPEEGEPEFLPVIKIREMRGGFTDKSDSVTDEIPERFRIQDGDILFSWSGSLLVKIWTGGRGALNQHIFKVWSEDHPNWFVHQWTLQHLRFFRQIAASKATTMGHINRGHLSEAKCVVPPEKVLQAAGKTLSPYYQKFVSNALECRALTRTRDILLPRLLNGEHPTSRQDLS